MLQPALHNMIVHIKNPMDTRSACSQKDKPHDFKIKEAMLLMCGESWLKKFWDAPAGSIGKCLSVKAGRIGGRLSVTSVHEGGEIAGNGSLKTAEKMGREASANEDKIKAVRICKCVRH